MRNDSSSSEGAAVAGSPVFRFRPLFPGFLMLLLFAVLSAYPMREAGADEAGLPFTIENMKLQLLDTPIATFENVNNTQSSSRNNKWVGLEVFFIPGSSFVKSGWYDDVTMEGVVVLETDAAAVKGKSASDKMYIVFTGKTRFFTIEADDKRHLGLLLVPPKLANRFTPTKTVSTKNFWASRIRFYSRNRILLGEGYWDYRGLLKNEQDVVLARRKFEQLENGRNEMANVVWLEGGLYSKEKTPWALFNFDFYDLIYDDVASTGGDGAARQ